MNVKELREKLEKLERMKCGNAVITAFDKELKMPAIVQSISASERVVLLNTKKLNELE